MGYVEEDDDLETDRSDEDDDNRGASGGADLGFFNRSFLHARRTISLSGSDSEGNDRRASSGSLHRSRRLAHTPLGREKSRHSGRLASWSGPASSGDEQESRKRFERGRRSSSHRPHGRRTSGGSSESGSGSDRFTADERNKSFRSSGSLEGERRKQFSLSDGKMKKIPGGMVPVGPAVTLSAKAAAIVNATSPPAMKPKLPTRGNNETEVEEKSDAIPSIPVHTSTAELSLVTPMSPMPDRSRRSLSVRSISLSKPVELEHPVVLRTTSSFNTKVECITGYHPVAGHVGRRDHRPCLRHWQYLLCWSWCMSSHVRHGSVIDRTDQARMRRPVNGQLDGGFATFNTAAPVVQHLMVHDIMGRCATPMYVSRRPPPKPIARVAMKCYLWHLVSVVSTLAILFRPRRRRRYFTVGMHIPSGYHDPP